MTPSTNFGFLIFGDPSNPSVGQIQYSHVDDEMNFITNDTQQVVIKSSGNVGIGTVGPGAKLDVRAGTAIGLTLDQTNSANIDWLRFTYDDVLGNYGSFRMASNAVNYVIGPAVTSFVITGGNVGIGTTNPLAKLQVVGTAGNETGTWATVSDRRLKEEIQPLQTPLDTVMRLQGVSFRWKDKSKGEKRHFGFISQDVEEVIPEWVWIDSNGYKWLEREGSDALLVEAIKEQQQQIEQLRREVAELRERIGITPP